MNSSTIDKDEMKKLDDLSSVWWEPAMEILQTAGTFYLDYIVKIVRERNLVENVQVLDMGCGGGLLSEPLAQHGFNVLGIDVSRKLLERAQNHAQLNPSLRNLTYKLESIEDHAANNPEKYDIVILNFVLQHVKNQEIVLNNCVKALKPGGLFLVSTAAKTFWSWIYVVILPELYYGSIPKNSHNWHKFICAKDVISILDKNRCVVNEAKGASYDSVQKSWSWHDDVDRGFYTLLATKQ